MPFTTILVQIILSRKWFPYIIASFIDTLIEFATSLLTYIYISHFISNKPLLVTIASFLA